MVNESENSANERIERGLLQAASGSKEGAELFFKALLEGPLFVPDRYQSAPLSDSPQYPNDFVHVLGIQDGNRVIVPVFSHAHYIEEWCGTDLQFKSYSGTTLLSKIPEDWWVIVNPGQDAEKEISPWEAQTLKGGPEGIAEVLDDLFAEEVIEPLALEVPSESEYSSLRSALASSLPTIPEIARAFLLKELGKNIEGEDSVQILIGLEIPTNDLTVLDRVKDQVAQVAQPCQIGDDPVKIIVGSDAREGIALGLFKDAEPIFVRK